MICETFKVFFINHEINKPIFSHKFVLQKKKHSENCKFKRTDTIKHSNTKKHQIFFLAGNDPDRKIQNICYNHIENRNGKEYEKSKTYFRKKIKLQNIRNPRMKKQFALFADLNINKTKQKQQLFHRNILIALLKWKL